MYPVLQFESWSLSLYFLIISLDFCFLLFYLKQRARKFGFPVVSTLDLGILISVSGLAGARLFHVFYEYPHYYLENPLAIFKIWEGGYVFLGGILMGLLSGIIYLKIKHQNIFRFLDLFAPIVALGYSIGRLACFFQGCCYGKQTNSVFGLHFDNLTQTGETLARHPTQLYASVGELILYFILIYQEKKLYQPHSTLQSSSSQKRSFIGSGAIFIYWMMGHGINRMIMEFFRDDPRGPLWMNMGISFWLAGLLLFTGVLISRMIRP